MKINALSILVLIALGLTACGTIANTPATSPAPTTGPVIHITPAPTMAPTTQPVQTEPTAQPTAVPQGPSAVVTSDPLNLRLGPGVDYPVVQLLYIGDKVSVVGRSTNGDWLVVKTAAGTEGWVYSSYVQTSGDLASLPVDEAYGGPVNANPTPIPTTASVFSIQATIENNQAAVTLRKFPANRDVTVSLGLPGENPDLIVATGRTDAGGAADLSFMMPAHWSDGSKVNQNKLLLTASTTDWQFTRSATLQYYTQ
ncbi:MAG: SH3 domain-containing protein [Chloroflexi bacterium]|nr:SH3 domain-containing protein [Chloroflexota bacterium]